MNIDRVSEAWEEKVLGGPRFLKAQLGLTKLIWTAMGFSGVLLMVLSQTGELRPFNIDEAFGAQSYIDRGGFFVAAPLIAAFFFVASLRVSNLLVALNQKATEALRAAGKLPPGVVSIRTYFLGTLFSLAFAEGLTLLGFILVSQSKQGAHMVPFAAAFMAAWLRAYPTRAKIRALFFPESD